MNENSREIHPVHLNYFSCTFQQTNSIFLSQQTSVSISDYACQIQYTANAFELEEHIGNILGVAVWHNICSSP
jgi:hypothetical protein